MTGLTNDIQHGLRANIKHWPSTIVIVLLLGIGIGSTASMFNIHGAMTWRPLPFVQADSLVSLSEAQSRQGCSLSAVSWPTYLDWRREIGPFSAYGAFRRAHFNVGGGAGEPENLQGTLITPDLFPMLGVEPRVGRNFTADEGHLGRHRVVLVGHSLWETRFNKDPQVVGRTLRVDGEPHVIVGIMPPRFGFPEFAELWLPLAVNEESARRDTRSHEVIARLKPGVTLAQAQIQMDAMHSRIARLHPDTLAGWGVRMSPLKEKMLPPEASEGSELSSVAAFLILAITCANVGLLLIVRFQARSKNTAVRLALGATRTGLTLRFLFEAAWLAAAGGLVGLPLSILITRLTLLAIPSRIPYWLDFGIRPITFVLVVVITSMAAIMAGLLPAGLFSRLSLTYLLKEETRSTTAGGRVGRLRQAFAIGQFAMSFVLLAGALLVGLSYLRLQGSDRGFDARHVLTMRFSLRGYIYGDEPSRLRQAWKLLRRAQELPAVRQVALSNALPLRGNVDGGVRIVVDGRPVLPGEEEETQWRAVSVSYFETFRIPLLRGRRFTSLEEEEGAPVVLVSDTLARRLWPNGDAIGRRLRPAGSETWREVIGVTGTVRRAYRMAGLGHAAADRQVYAPLPSYAGHTYWLAIRSDKDAHVTSIAGVKSALREVDGELPFFNVATMEEVVREAEWLPILWVRMFTAFSLMALALTSLGTYGIVSHAVTLRTQEIGVRMALGAPTVAVSRLVLRQALRLAAIGVAGGLALSVAAAPLMHALIQDANARDPRAFTAAALALALTSVIAAGIPARRAAKVDPVVALRCE